MCVCDLDRVESWLYSDSKIIKLLQKLTELSQFQPKKQAEKMGIKVLRHLLNDQSHSFIMTVIVIFQST